MPRAVQHIPVRAEIGALQEVRPPSGTSWCSMFGYMVMCTEMETKQMEVAVAGRSEGMRKIKVSVRKTTRQFVDIRPHGRRRRDEDRDHLRPDGLEGPLGGARRAAAAGRSERHLEEEATLKEKHMMLHWPHRLAMLAPRETQGNDTRTDWSSEAELMLDHALVGSGWSSARVPAHANPAEVSSDHRPRMSRLRREVISRGPHPRRPAGTSWATAEEGLNESRTKVDESNHSQAAEKRIDGCVDMFKGRAGTRATRDDASHRGRPPPGGA